MAFNRKYLGKVSSSGNGLMQNVWAYNGSATGSNEVIATIVANGYFDNAQTTLATAEGQLLVGDVMIIAGSDANGMYVVTQAITQVQIATFAAVGTIDTAQIEDDAITSAKLDEGLVRHTSVSLTLAEFIALYTTSFELVAAPGASKKLILHRCVLGIDYGGTALAAGGAVHIQYDATANGAGVKASGTLAAATAIAATADTTFGFAPVETTLVDATTLNKSLCIAMATQDFTGGTTSTYEVDTWTSVMDLT